jgi:hypothetical protein
MRKAAVFGVITAFGLSAAVALAQDHAPSQHDPAMHQHDMTPVPDSRTPTPDSRQFVDFPPEARQHMLTNMRDHFEALSEILTAVAANDYDKAAQIAETRLGPASMGAQGCQHHAAGGDAAASMSAPATPPTPAQQMARLMPDPMQHLGMRMHLSASEFASKASEAAKTGNTKPALAALSRTTEACVACHTAYRVR